MDKKNLLLFTMSGLLLMALFSTIPVKDYHYYVTACRLWIENPEELYSPKNNSFYYMPWSLYLIAPLTVFPDHVGQALLNTLSAVGLGMALYILCPKCRVLAVGLALFTPYPMSVLFLGQWDALILLAIALLYWSYERKHPWLLGAMLTLALTKPTNVLLVLIVLLWNLRTWSPALLARVFCIPVTTILSSFVLCGSSWVGRYLDMLSSNPPDGFNVSLWQLQSPYLLTGILIVIILSSITYALREKSSSPSLYSLLLSGNLTLSLFLTPYAFVLLTPGIAFVAQHMVLMGILLWISSWITFLLFWFPREGNWMYLHSCICYVAILCTYLRHYSVSQKQS